MDKERFEITVDKECDCLKITRNGLEKLVDYYVAKLAENRPLKKNFYKQAFLTGKFVLCYDALKLFSEMDELFDETETIVTND